MTTRGGALSRRLRDAALGAGAVCVLCVLSGCGASRAESVEGPADTTVDRCVVALRFVSDEAEERVARDGQARLAAPDETPVPPTTEVSLVRICDQNGRIVSSLGAQQGVCQYVPDTPAALVSARCWWPGQTGVALRVMREGQRIYVVALDEEGSADPVTLGTVEVPQRARIDVLAPGRPRPER